ncbi:hypothetical protein MMC17_008286 [Xylographa soralifera]|nr:hypothetical protein [Xylographa soralifera]
MHTILITPSASLPASALAAPSSEAYLEFTLIGNFVPASLAPANDPQGRWVVQLPGIAEAKLGVWVEKGGEVKLWVRKGERTVGSGVCVVEE